MSQSEADIDKSIIEAIEDHYSSRESPYFLADLGDLLRTKDFELPEGVRLKEYLESRLKEHFTVVQDPDIPARIAVAPHDKEHNVMQYLSGQSRGLREGYKIDYGRLPFALITAFCKSPQSDTRLYFKVTRPFRYATGMHPPGEDFIEIEGKFRSPSLAGKNLHALSRSDRQAIYQQIEEWADANSVDLRSIYYDRVGNTASGRASSTERNINALQRLIHAQDPAIRREFRIPGDIADILMGLP